MPVIEGVGSVGMAQDLVNRVQRQFASSELGGMNAVIEVVSPNRPEAAQARLVR